MYTHKEEYLSSIGVVPSYGSQLLLIVAPEFERKFNKDVANFSKEEICELLKSLKFSNYDNLRERYSLLERYSYWVIKEGYILETVNGYNKITTEDLRNCLTIRTKNEIYVNESELDSIVAAFKNPMDRFLLMCLFEGIRGGEYKEIINLKSSDIDFAKGIAILCTGRTVNVGTAFLNRAAEADTIKELSVVGGKYEKTYPFYDIGNIYKISSAKAKIPNATTITARLYAIRLDTGHQGLTAPRLHASGFCYYSQKLADELGVGIWELPYIHEEQKIIEKYGLERKTPTALRKIWNEYLGN